jgi:hypothetical protein
MAAGFRERLPSRAGRAASLKPANVRRDSSAGGSALHRIDPARNDQRFSQLHDKLSANGACTWKL